MFTDLYAMLQKLTRAVDALSTPILKVWDQVLALPLIGSIEDQRSAMILERLRAEVVQSRCRFVILDITGVESVDTATAARLLEVVSATELLGARCLLTGVRPAVTARSRRSCPRRCRSRPPRRSPTGRPRG